MSGVPTVGIVPERRRQSWSFGHICEETSTLLQLQLNPDQPKIIIITLKMIYIIIFLEIHLL